MVTIEQIEHGLAFYLDRELMPNLPEQGIQKVLIGMTMGLAVKKASSLILALRENPVVKMLEIIDENGNVDLETVKNEFKRNVPDSGFTLDIPMLGSMTFHRSDVDLLYKYITGSQEVNKNDK